jgi:hypothetical protein
MMKVVLEGNMTMLSYSVLLHKTKNVLKQTRYTNPPKDSCNYV